MTSCHSASSVCISAFVCSYVRLGPALDQVAGDRERRAREGEQRDVGQLSATSTTVSARTVCRSRARTVAGGRGRLGARAGSRDRPGAGRDVDAEPDGVGRHDDVAVEHGRVDAVAAHRLHVVAAASSGCLIASRMLPSPRMARYSGRLRPA